MVNCEVAQNVNGGHGTLVLGASPLTPIVLPSTGNSHEVLPALRGRFGHLERVLNGRKRRVLAGSDWVQRPQSRLRGI